MGCMMYLCGIYVRRGRHKNLDLQLGNTLQRDGGLWRFRMYEASSSNATWSICCSVIYSPWELRWSKMTSSSQVIDILVCNMSWRCCTIGFGGACVGVIGKLPCCLITLPRLLRSARVASCSRFRICYNFDHLQFFPPLPLSILQALQANSTSEKKKR